MRISELLNEDNIEIAAELADKDDALRRLIRLHAQSGSVQDAVGFTQKVYEREAMGSTATSGRIAIPSGIAPEASHPALTAITVQNGVEFGAPDHRAVRLIFMIAGADSEETSRLKVRLQRLLMDASFAALLSAAKDKETFLTLLREREDRRFPIINANTDRRLNCSKFLKRKYRYKRPRRKLFSHFTHK